MRISEGIEEDGIVVGNTYDKYSSKNPIVRWMMNGFSKSLSDLIAKVSPATIHEIGCGEGFWVLQWIREGIEARGSDFSSQVIDLARSNAIEQKLSADIFTQRSIYGINVDDDSADLIVCCEVMEHLESPAEGLQALNKIAKKFVILSVPREPIWCALNLARGKYLSSLGNTPGHIQHWSRSAFIELVSKYFDIIDIKSPLPWTMLLCQVKENKGKVNE
jgi:2-polyprenyl-3-methyl-5-hydroxy-6-metoxy-1,4-benzoquinol methylase